MARGGSKNGSFNAFDLGQGITPPMATAKRRREGIVDLNNLTPDVLRELYTAQGMPEEEIAKRFGTYQVKISRLRSKWGIPTICKGSRAELGLPALTETQEQVLVGSLLGDGWMHAPSRHSARFSEGHCLEQEPYLRWKMEVLQPYTLDIRDGTKTDKKNGKQYRSKTFSTIACPRLRPFYDAFYPAPARIRVFPSDLPQRMTPFVLAVWFQDDGSLTVRGEPRIAFGLCDLSRERALRALRALGLRPVMYGEGGDQCIQFPKQREEFRRLVEPHLHESMRYKLPFENEGAICHRHAREQAPADKVSSLYAGGLTKDEIAKLLGVGASTVSRRLKETATGSRRGGPRKFGTTPEAASALLGAVDPKIWALLPSSDQDTQVAEVIRLLRATGFPLQPEPDAETAARYLEDLRRSEMHFEGDQIVPIRRKGIGLCRPFFPERYRAVSAGRKSAFEAWHSDKDLEYAVRFQLKVGDPVLPHRVLRALTMQYRTPSIFRPTVARHIYQHFCPAGGRVWDPCSGYGGRLAGAVAAGVQYLGTDVDPETVAGNQRLAAVLGASNARVVLSPAEVFNPPTPVDLVFTSPPYFDRERYSDNAQQSWQRYRGMGDWVAGFLKPVIQTAFRSLTPVGLLVVNIADLKSGKQIVPLVSETERVASEVGFVQTQRLSMPLPALNRKDPTEPVLVFRKPVR